MSTPLLPDVLWNLIQLMLPSAPHRPKGGRPSPARPCLSHRDSVCSPQRDTVGDATSRAGLRLGHDLLAAVARLAAVFGGSRRAPIPQTGPSLAASAI